MKKQKLRSKLRSTRFLIPANIKNTGLPEKARIYMEEKQTSIFSDSLMPSKPYLSTRLHFLVLPQIASDLLVCGQKCGQGFARFHRILASTDRHKVHLCSP